MTEIFKSGLMMMRVQIWELGFCLLNSIKDINAISMVAFQQYINHHVINPLTKRLATVFFYVLLSLGLLKTVVDICSLLLLE